MLWNSSIAKRMIKPRLYTFGTMTEAEPEIPLIDVKFNIYKHNIRPRPLNKDHVVVFSCFSEFGSEILLPLYCIPRLLQRRYLGYYVIAMGWQGREYLYRHLVDEFWELKEEYQWLREYCRAFHHVSRNLRKVERAVHRNHGRLADANVFSSITLSELYQDIPGTKKTACWTPTPSEGAYKAVERFLKPNSVGVTARFRQCYGRNLQLDFYKRLLDNLQDMGYDPIWIGEKTTTYECPYNHITNFRDTPESYDLEKTLALVSKLNFTIQFWTASSRLAGLVGTPFIIFESPDQIYGAPMTGHEGLRLNLCSKGNKKIVISHFKDVYNDNEMGLSLVSRAIDELRKGDFSDLVSSSCDYKIVEDSMKEFVTTYKV